MRSHPLFTAYLAFASVSFFWGTTYLGIRIALESIPPLMLVPMRFIASGLIMIAGSKLAGLQFPKGKDLIMTGLYGAMILGIGNTCLTLSEKFIPSSLAALFVTISPIWMIGIEALFADGEKLTKGAVTGVALGMVGVLILVAPDVMRQGFGGAVFKGFLLLQLGGAAWSLGSILQRRRKSEANPVASAAIQQFTAGLFFLPAMLWNWQPFTWTPTGIGAIVYLITFGSIVGYTSYVIALNRLPVALVSTYTYINPIVAAILGWLFYREPFGRPEITAMAIIFAGVYIVKRYGR